MTCRELIEKLDDLLEGRLSPADRRAAEDHLLVCDECRDLQGLAATAAPVPPTDLVGAVLRRTSGAVCGSARARLCDHVDRTLAGADEELVGMHLSGCPECAGLASALARLAIDLPDLAEIEPDPSFAAAVFARTSRRTRPLDSMAARLSVVWQRLAHRPRIAWEGAYAGWIILAILFGTPSAPFASVPGTALALARTVQESVRANAGAKEEVGLIGQAAGERWQQAKIGMQGAGRDLKAGTEQRLSAYWTGLKQNLGTAWRRVASGRTTNENDKDEGERR